MKNFCSIDDEVDEDDDVKYDPSTKPIPTPIPMQKHPVAVTVNNVEVGVVFIIVVSILLIFL